MMEKGLQIKTYKVDYDFLKNNYLDPKVWDFKATIFNYKDLQCVISLSSIDVQTKRLVFDVTMYYGEGKGLSGDKDSYSMSAGYPIDREDYTSKMFQNRVNSIIKSLLGYTASSKSSKVANAIFSYNIKKEKETLGEIFDDNYAEKFPPALSEYIEDVRENYIFNNSKIDVTKRRYDDELRKRYKADYYKVFDLMINEMQSQPETKKEIEFELPQKEFDEMQKLIEDYENLTYLDIIEKYDLEEPEGI